MRQLFIGWQRRQSLTLGTVIWQGQTENGVLVFLYKWNELIKLYGSHLIGTVSKKQCRHRNNLLLRHPTHTCPTTVAVSLIASKYNCSLWGKDLPRVLDSWHSWMTNSGRRISWRHCSFEKASSLEGHLFQSLSGADAGTSFDIQSNADVSPTDVTTPCSWSWSWPSFNLPAHWLIGQKCLDLPSGYPMADLFLQSNGADKIYEVLLTSGWAQSCHARALAYSSILNFVKNNNLKWRSILISMSLIDRTSCQDVDGIAGLSMPFGPLCLTCASIWRHIHLCLL